MKSQEEEDKSEFISFADEINREKQKLFGDEQLLLTIQQPTRAELNQTNVPGRQSDYPSMLASPNSVIGSLLSEVDEIYRRQSLNENAQALQYSNFKDKSQ